MKVLILVVALLGVVLAQEDGPLRALFKKRVAEYREKGIIGDWSPEEGKLRFEIFKKVAVFLKKLAEKIENWSTKLNAFALMTPEERRAHLGLKNATEMVLEERSFMPRLAKRTPSQVDYTSTLPGVKDQGQCGSCWTFGAAAPLEYQINKYESHITTLSEQNLLDCTYETSQPTRDGCNGGSPGEAWEWVKNNGGMASQSDYPYQMRDGYCNTGKANALGKYSVHGTVWVGNGDDKTEEAVGNYESGVLAAMMFVKEPLYYYSNGIYSDAGCVRSPQDINHAVTIVGYGTDGGYHWKVRNSWGTSWGEAGYVRMARGYGINTCNIAQWGHYPNVSSYRELEE